MAASLKCIAIQTAWRTDKSNGRTVMKQVIVITGASSGFGELTAHELAKGGHVVYASMRETTGRNVRHVGAAKRFAAENKVDLGTIVLDVASPDSVVSAIQLILSQ